MKIFMFLILTVLAASLLAQDTVKIQTSAVCEMCKEKIEGDLIFEKGVIESNLDLETKVLTVVYKPRKTSPELIRERITELGYDADNKKRKEKAYEKLPLCCREDATPHDHHP